MQHFSENKDYIEQDDEVVYLLLNFAFLKYPQLFFTALQYTVAKGMSTAFSRKYGTKKRQSEDVTREDPKHLSERRAD